MAATLTRVSSPSTSGSPAVEAGSRSRTGAAAQPLPQRVGDVFAEHADQRPVLGEVAGQQKRQQGGVGHQPLELALVVLDEHALDGLLGQQPRGLLSWGVGR